MRPFYVGLEPETYRRLQELAEAAGISTRRLCKEILEDFVETQAKEYGNSRKEVL